MEYKIKLPDSNIDYLEFSDLKFLKYTPETETQVVIYPNNIDYNKGILNYLSTRNFKNSYQVDMTRDKVLTQLLPQKKLLTDKNIKYYLDTNFNYFVNLDSDFIDGELPFTIAEGLIFRFTEPFKPIDQYTYYIMGDNKVEQIPNFKTLEVMLAQRNQNYLSVRVIEKSQLDDILKEFPLSKKEDMSASWSESLKDQLNFANYLDLKQSAKSAGAMVEAAAAEADKNIKAVKAEKDAEKAKADQAKAEADAAKAAANAAIEQAKADQAKANAAEAEAKQKQAEADAKKAEFESKGT